MDWERYKAACDAPDTFPRWMLEQTVLLLEAQGESAQLLRAALAGAALEKPRDHKGGPVTDMLRLDLSADDVHRVHELVSAAAAAGLTTAGTRSRGLGGFAEAWREYLAHLRADRQRGCADR